MTLLAILVLAAFAVGIVSHVTGEAKSSTNLAIQTVGGFAAIALATLTVL